MKPLVSTEALISHLREEIAGRLGSPDEVLVHDERLPARQACGALLRPSLPRALSAALQSCGIKMLYEHQVAAIRAVRAGNNLVVTTPGRRSWPGN